MVSPFVASHSRTRLLPRRRSTSLVLKCLQKLTTTSSRRSRQRRRKPMRFSTRRRRNPPSTSHARQSEGCRCQDCCCDRQGCAVEGIHVLQVLSQEGPEAP